MSISDQYPLIIAHRGDSSHAPENTVAAFRMALEKGADGIEFDVQLSIDGVPVVTHDHNLQRTGLVDRNVEKLTVEQLQQIDVGSWFNAKFPQRARPYFIEEKIPTLAQVLRVAEHFAGPIYIELKCGHSDYEKLARAVCDEIRDSPQLSTIIVKSFKLAAIPVIRSILPEVQTAALFAPKIMTVFRRKKHLLTLAHEIGARQVSLHYSLATRKLCTLAAEMHMPVTIWTADNPRWVHRCRKLVIRSLITNDPARLLAVRDTEGHK